MSEHRKSYDFVGEVKRTAFNRQAGDVWMLAARGPVSVTNHGKPRFVLLTCDMMRTKDGTAEFPKANISVRASDLWMMAASRPVRITAYGKPQFIILMRERFDHLVATRTGSSIIQEPDAAPQSEDDLREMARQNVQFIEKPQTDFAVDLRRHIAKQAGGAPPGNDETLRIFMDELRRAKKR